MGARATAYFLARAWFTHSLIHMSNTMHARGIISDSYNL